MPIEEHQNVIIQPLDDTTCEQDKFASRRNLLKLGAAGLPMVLTLKASARAAAVSQLSCFFRLPARIRIMVNENGEAWSSTTLNVRFSRNRQAWRKDDLDAFIADTDTVYFPNGVPSSYVPATCNTPPSGNWIYCGWAKYQINSNAKITPSNYINGNDEFEDDGSKKALYVMLTIEYANSRSSGWPGISCVVSILNYLDTL